jgi:hypothetical protein
MPRARWFVIGFFLVTALVGGVLNARGPFAAHPALAYPKFLADVEAGRVERIVQWQDQLEVTENGQLLSVVVPPDADLEADLALARRAGGVAMSFGHIPDAWLGLFTPWIPVLILLGAAAIWTTGIVRNRRVASRADAAGSPQAAD